MTYITTCLNCGSDHFIYDPRNFQLVQLHPMGGIVSAPQVPNWKRKPNKSHDKVTCADCRLEVERERLDPDFDWEADCLDFNIKHYG